jgi:hypothetical protein
VSDGKRIIITVDLVDAICDEGREAAIELVKEIDKRFACWDFTKPLMDYFASLQADYEADEQWAPQRETKP